VSLVGRKRVAGIGIVAIISALLACTEGSGVMQVTIRNDSSADVVLKQCDVRCDVTHEVHELRSGQSVDVNTSYANVHNYWMVLDPSRRLLGCIDLLYQQRQEGVIVPVTSARACPK
jgi:hypothetical protein